MSQLDDREMLAPGPVTDTKLESSAAPTTNLHLWLSARRASRPTSPRLETRCATSGRLPEVEFIGGSAVQRSVWPLRVVPGDEQRHLPTMKPLLNLTTALLRCTLAFFFRSRGCQRLAPVKALAARHEARTDNAMIRPSVSRPLPGPVSRCRA